MGVFSLVATLFWGILTGAALTVLVLYLVNTFWGTPKWLIGLIGVFLLFFLSFQFTVMFGAGKVKGMVADIASLGNASLEQSDWRELVSTHPVLKFYFNQIETTASEVTDQKTSALSLINNKINGFMWRRAAWVLGGVVVCCLMAAGPQLIGNGGSNGRRQAQRGASRYRAAQSTGRSHRPPRRRR